MFAFEVRIPDPAVPSPRGGTIAKPPSGRRTPDACSPLSSLH